MKVANLPMRQIMRQEFICEDVTNIEGTELNQRYPDNVVRALVGCAPCQPFSKIFVEI